MVTFPAPFPLGYLGRSALTWQPKHMKRFLRYSLRTLFLVTLLVAVALSFFLARHRRMRAAIIAIESAGGTHGAYREGPEWLREIVGDERYFMNAERVTLGPSSGDYDFDGRFDDNRLRDLIPHLNAFSKFKILEIPGADITDDGLAYLRDLDRLQWLTIHSPKITDKGIQHLHKIPSLRKLSVHCDSVTPDALAELQRALPGLEVNP
jgi:hypothetical protein